MAPKTRPDAPVNPLPPGLRHLPPPDPDAAEHMRRVRAAIAATIDAQGFLPFDRYMDLALYAPGLGYYSAGAAKFGAGGDFVTAPGISALFGAALAHQIAELIERGCPHVIELGAGTGRMAADILAELARLDCLPERYEVVEVSADLRARQRETLRSAVPQLVDRVAWLDRLPAAIDGGVVLGNEVLDALPVTLVRTQAGEVLELGVGLQPNRVDFAWTERPASAEIRAVADGLALADGYRTELHLGAQGLVRSLAEIVRRGMVLFIDYGFPVSEYYHPQRSEGTLMCHYRHHAHTDPLLLPGLQDITSHLDFTALARAGEDAGLALMGYTTQAHFLVNCGLLDALARIDPNDVARYAPACAGVQKLLSPAEMGELFKVIAFGRGIEPPLLGFGRGDRSGRL